jgi:histidinol-phosphate phosphatase family protein
MTVGLGSRFSQEGRQIEMRPRRIKAARLTLICTPTLKISWVRGSSEGVFPEVTVAARDSASADRAWADPVPVGTTRPGILLDRDGTIIVDHGYVGCVGRVELIPGAAKAIASFNAAGIPVAVVTNQAGVARGFYGLDDVALVHEYIAGRLAEHGAHIDLFLFCPYHPAGVVEEFTRPSEDRKPRSGMARAAQAALNLDLSSSWVVGDRPEDLGLAAAVGASAVYLGAEEIDRPGVWSFASLADAAPFILERLAP